MGGEFQGIAEILNLAGNLGIPGVLLFLWLYNDKKYTKILDQYKLHMDESRKMMDESRKMYEAAAKKNEQYAKLADSMRELIVMTATCMSEIKTAVLSNQFCPFNRIDRDEKRDYGSGH